MSSDAPDAGAASAYDAPPRDPPVRGTIARYATGSLGTGGFATLPGLVLAYYLTDSLGVAALAAGAVITVAKVWDVVIDPVIGALTDRDLARHGTRRRLMLIGACSIAGALRADLRRAAGPRAGRRGDLGVHRLHADGDRVQPVPGAVHRAARRADARATTSAPAC